MRKMVVHLHAGTVGTDSVEAILVDDDTSEKEISDIAWQMSLDHAKSFGIYPYPDEDDDDGEYSDNIEGWAEKYVPEQHDQLRSGGGSFEEDFEFLARNV